MDFFQWYEQPSPESNGKLGFFVCEVANLFAFHAGGPGFESRPGHFSHWGNFNGESGIIARATELCALCSALGRQLAALLRGVEPHGKLMVMKSIS